jgi:two-component system nitrogen regulation sensor histidine kinase NtrY
MIIGTNFSFKLARPIRNLNSAIISLKRGNFENSFIKKSSDKDDISQLTNSFYDMSETINYQKNNLEKTNKTINDQLEFINNIINNSPYAIFVINKDELVFQNDLSKVFQTPTNSSFEILLETLSNQIYEKKDFNKKSFEVNLTIKVNGIDRIYFFKSIFIENNSLFDQIIIFNDYTDLISAEKNNAIADLARKISHEIKNPLTPMLLSAEFIESQVDDEELKNSILSIKRQIFLIQNLVNEFSTYARLPQANIIRLNLSDISLIYIEEYKKNYPNITFTNNIEKEIIIDFDQSYLDIIFNNLFKNSIEALNNSSNPTIEIYLKKDERNIKFSFFDNGPGYEGDIENLTNPYFSTKNSSGLGLSLIKKIVKDNNGKMYIKSNKYSGFKVEINLYV